MSLTLEITLKLLNQSCQKPLYLLTVQEAHKEYNSLTDQIQAKYKQLDSGKYGAVGTPAFDAEACELANLLVCVSQLCQKLNLPTPKELYRPYFSSNEDTFRIKIHTLGRQFVCCMEDAALFP